MSEPTRQLPPEEEEPIGNPSFELWVRDGEPVVSGSYFLHPPLRAVQAEWDTADAHKLLVRADDGSAWYADDVPREGRLSVVLHPVDGDHPALQKAEAVAHFAAE
ncbi:hypothetical protein [Gordonia polyisoprenivorans]|uniref:hypothetical protein n=1 Tax=Gordonia polyisoprenivorans TaxID=84595 RepID=UPI001AD78491|nr:hypothetical protein [Gordonia polyisoprenivorans]QTI71009.1 hypothetical protein J6U32_11080 [Gordonia polyisoprenivorans]